ncbi:MAG: AAA family ATPase [Lachnospiraceae bacterium]|nr:AAA family ATPase [Lachnospiraceae bacterium]MEE3460752.1 AAA family ATPase [Lachnospiraceae bacterium]
MKRDIYKDLLRWKNKKKKKPLIIRGARQVGKTYIIKEFASNEYDDFIYLVCDKKNAVLTSIFDGPLKPDRILPLIELAEGRKIISGKTLLIFDEVQEIPRALESLKYFCEEARQYDVIAAGSLMGIAMHEGTSFPVGKVDELFLYPMSFAEYLSAEGYDDLRELIEDHDQNSIVVFKDTFKDLLKEYYLVGGMPEAVETWVDTKDFKEVRNIQKSLLDFYDNDFSKHAPADQIVRIRAVWNSILKQLSKENKKFIYGMVRSGSRAKDYEIAINWLRDYGVINIINRVSKPGIPLKAYADQDIFKIYILDVGLMCAMGDLDERVIFEGNTIFTEFKGALTEQFVSEQLTPDFRNSLYYWSAQNSSGEIDFVLQHKNTVYPIEVKAEENLKARSLRSFCGKYGLKGIRTSMSDYREQDWMVNVPLYELREYFKG